MADPNRLAGVMSVMIDGRAFSIAGEGAYTVSSVSRETLTGQDGVHGYAEKPMPGKMSWKGRDGSQVAIAALNGAVNATVVFQLANGKVVTGRNMWKVGEPIEVNTEDATFPVSFEGPDVAEI